jgi:hypothetical protein
MQMPQARANCNSVNRDLRLAAIGGSRGLAEGSHRRQLLSSPRTFHCGSDSLNAIGMTMGEYLCAPTALDATVVLSVTALLLKWKAPF